MARFGDASQQPGQSRVSLSCLHSYLSLFSPASSQIKPSTQPLSSETELIMVGTNCILCNKPGRPCASCKSTAYHCVECQQTDWPLHKLLCKKFSSFSPGPDSDSKLRLCFPVDSKVPELIWVNCAELNAELQSHLQLYMERDIPYSEQWPIGHTSPVPSILITQLSPIPDTTSVAPAQRPTYGSKRPQRELCQFNGRVLLL
jgi:hypothetical protein